MRKLLLILILLLPLLGMSQRVYPEPPVKDQPFHFDATTEQLLPLEIVKATMKTKLRLAGIGGVSSGYIIPNKQSTVLLPATDSMFFVTSSSSSTASISAGLQKGKLFKMDNSGEERQLVLSYVKGFLGSSKGKASDKIDYEVVKDSERFIIVLSKKLAPGEYAIILDLLSAVADKTTDIFCFRVE